MHFTGRNIHRARANYCSNQSDLMKDEILKKFWSDLADEWIALDDKATAERHQLEH
jgi:hypothetical protein